MKIKSDLIKLDKATRLHQCPNPIFGLTGGIATGKSESSRYLLKKGITVIDADELIHEVYEDSETIDFVSSLSPQAVQGKEIDFSQLRNLFFQNDDLKRKLESFLYNKLPEKFREKLPKDPNELVIYDVPLLFEKGLDDKVDASIVIFAPESIQRERLKIRDPHTPAEIINKILESQEPIESKKEKADFVIENTTKKEDLYKALDKFLEKVKDIN